ncbi:hypothetical protein ABL78_0099 [Leptomonas seymouri]|uniref:Uncharacterized protein n=1 Tax=Leptomonas seymouri TaxID=5684 RepID=A0A0N0P9A2_LEPSE|nr:hypothetical protein ABL78_0099 [Leptomonas seymouri]|eukprot:KPI90866.1 hypothetical protein ABL78_0099 [Leptomonas seymouri]
MTSSGSNSLLADVAVLDSGSDDDSSFVLRNIRQLPLPSVPTVLAEDQTARLSITALSNVAPTQPPSGPSAAPQQIHAVPITPAFVPLVPHPIQIAPTLNTPAAVDVHVARILRPPVPLATPRAITSGSQPSLFPSSSSSVSGTAPVLTSTATCAVAQTATCANKNEDGAASENFPSVPLLPAASPSLSVVSSAHSLSPHPSSLALKPFMASFRSPVAVSNAATGSSSQVIPIPNPTLRAPLVASVAPHLSQPLSSAPGAAFDLPYAVTTLAMSTQASPTHPVSIGVDTPTPPSLVSASNRTATGAPAVPTPLLSSAIPVTPPPVAAVGSPPTATASAAPAPANNEGKEEKPHHMRRRRDVLEEADCALFTSPDVDEDSISAASSTSDSDEDDVYVGRTRRFGGAASRERQQQADWDGVAADTAEKRDTSQAHRRRHRHDSRRRSRSRRRKKKTVVKLCEVEGKGDAAPSREKTSQSSQSTHALTPDKVASARRCPPCAPTSSSVEKAVDALTTSDDESGSDSSTPLVFTSPAARFAALCKERTKSKDASQTNARKLAQRRVLGSRTDDGVETADIAVEGSHGHEDAESDQSRAGMVHFRFTGAFSDATSDSKMQSATLYEIGDGGRHKTQKPALPSTEATSAGDTVVLALNIRGMSPLHADASVVHPFVRAWVVSCATGRSLVQASAAVPCAVTHPFDIRSHKTRAPWWDAQVALRLSMERLRDASNDAMLLLEVLDFGNETIHGFPLLRSGLYPICWGFLMLRDCSDRSVLAFTENVHVQMFRYPQRTPWYLSWLEALLPLSWSAAAAHLQPSDLSTAFGTRTSVDGLTEVPRIYHIFKICNNRKIPYDGGMVVTLRQHSDPCYVPDTTDMLAYEEYLLSILVSGGGCCAVPRSTQAATRDHDTSDIEECGGRAMSSRLAPSVPASQWAPVTENYYRMDGERSLLPHEILHRSAVMGIVNCICFTHNGTLFALGVYRHLQHMVELRNPLLPDMPVTATLLGHTGHLHRIVFQKEDRYMLTCSSDGTVRVWQPAHPNSPFSADTCAGLSSVHCVCTLPHGFPVYAALFHQEKIIAGGFSDQLFVWGYEQPLDGELSSMVAADDSIMHLTATFTPELQSTPNEDALAAPTRVLLGELIYRVDNAGTLTEGGEPTITLSLASNERSNRVWSVHANGAVVCWRAVGEYFEGTARPPAASGHSWQMSVRHKVECSGASEVQVNGSYAIVVCGQSPLVFVYDATTCEQLRVVNTHLPAATPVCLLPDGEAFVGAVGDPSRLVAWECFDGGLCTPPTGYAQASPLYSVARMSWAESQQLSVMVSRSPCTAEDMVRLICGPSEPAPGQSATAYYYAKQEEQYRLQNMPSEMTLLTVAGTKRRRGAVIQTGDRRAAEAFCVMFGGELKAKRKSQYLAERTKASRQRETERNSRRKRLHQEVMMMDPSSGFAAAASTLPSDATEKGARMNAIINFWRGLVGQHKHGAGGSRRQDCDASASLQSSPQPPTQRALEYLEEDGNEEEV